MWKLLRDKCARSCSYTCLDPSKTFEFWFHGIFDKYVSTVDLNGKTVAKYVREQEKNEIVLEKLSVKEYEEQFYMAVLEQDKSPLLRALVE